MSKRSCENCGSSVDWNKENAPDVFWCNTSMAPFSKLSKTDLPRVCPHYMDRPPPDPSEFDKAWEKCSKAYPNLSSSSLSLCKHFAWNMWQAALDAAVDTVEGLDFTRRPKTTTFALIKRMDTVEAIRKLDPEDTP